MKLTKLTVSYLTLTFYLTIIPPPLKNLVCCPFCKFFFKILSQSMSSYLNWLGGPFIHLHRFRCRGMGGAETGFDYDPKPSMSVNQLISKKLHVPSTEPLVYLLIFVENMLDTNSSYGKAHDMPSLTIGANGFGHPEHFHLLTLVSCHVKHRLSAYVM